MIVSCPDCSARFRVADEKLVGKSVSLRCARCRKVFPVSAVPQAAAVDSPRAAGSETDYILIAHSDPALCETLGTLLSRHQFRYEVATDGEKALTCMVRKAPRVVIVDVSLPGLYAFEVVDKVRSRPGLENVKIILLSSVYNKMAYKCQPKSLYGADDYIEKHHLPDSLIPKIQQLTAPPGTASVSEEMAQDDWEEVNQSIRQAEEREVSTDDRSQAVEKAQRLARIIVSDIALYNQKRIEEAIACGRFFELFEAEIAEAKKVFTDRVSADIADREDFLLKAFNEFIDKRRQELNG